MTQNIILDRSFTFALEAIRFSENLRSINRYWFADQLGRSSASIGANIVEAQNAESRRDFIHKMKIAVKEAHESRYWFNLAARAYPQFDCSELLTKVNEIILILSKIIFTAVQREKQRQKPGMSTEINNFAK